MKKTMVIESLEMAIIKEKHKAGLTLFIAIMAHNIQAIDFMK